MANNYFKTLAQDLLTLEINTIIKEEMSAVKTPSSRRRVLYELASDYHKKLTKLNVRVPIYWEYAGIRSFTELRERAIEGGNEYTKKLISAPQDEQDALREEIKILERIQEQSLSVINIFHALRNRHKEEINTVDGYSDVPAHKTREVLQGERITKTADSHTASEKWNNDIDKYRMNEIEDLDLTAEQVVLIRKAWDIGTEQIVLQTVIQIDGDVTTRISERFARNPDNTILQMHNDSIATSTRFWSSLVKALGEIAGKAFGLILGK